MRPPSLLLPCAVVACVILLTVLQISSVSGSSCGSTTDSGHLTFTNKAQGMPYTSPVSLQSGEWSICMWSKQPPLPSPATRQIFAVSTQYTGGGMRFEMHIGKIDSKEDAIMLICQGSYLDSSPAGVTAGVYDTWTHFCYTIDLGNTMDAYINGVAVASSRAEGYGGNDQVAVGFSGATETVKVDELRLWVGPTRLSDQEILDGYNGNWGNKGAELVAYLRFNSAVPSQDDSQYAGTFAGIDGSLVVVETTDLLCPASGVVGDPQFMGFRGQSFQIHGVPQTIYNLLSSKRLQVNARFAFLSSGICTSAIKSMDGNLCWTHPGTYLDEISMQVRHNTTKAVGEGSITKILLSAGSAEKGLTVQLDEQFIEPSDSHVYDFTSGTMVPMGREEFEERIARVESLARQGPNGAATAPISMDEGADEEGPDGLPERRQSVRHRPIPRLGGRGHKTDGIYAVDFKSTHEVILYTRDTRLRVVNSDNFFNHEVSLLGPLDSYISHTDGESDVAPVPLLHGLLGQTVLLRRYPNKIRYIEGGVEDYSVSDIFGCDGPFDLFCH